MTVSQLIAALAAHDPDLPVVLNFGRNGLANGKACSHVEPVRAFCSDGVFVDAEMFSDDESTRATQVVVNLTPAAFVSSRAHA